jgi:cyclic beta-1,2-glucan synthetase
MAADVYAEPPHVGRGGWTWYTGSAGWMYQAGVEGILGLQLRGDAIVLDPCIPRSWPGYALAVRHRSATYDIDVENPTGASRGIASIEVDGIALPAGEPIPLHDDGKRHHVRVVLGAASSRVRLRG